MLDIGLDVSEAEPPVLEPVGSCLHGAELGECGGTQRPQRLHRPIRDVEGEHSASRRISQQLQNIRHQVPGRIPVRSWGRMQTDVERYGQPAHSIHPGGKRRSYRAGVQIARPTFAP